MNSLISSFSLTPIPPNSPMSLTHAGSMLVDSKLLDSEENPMWETWVKAVGEEIIEVVILERGDLDLDALEVDAFDGLTV